MKPDILRSKRFLVFCIAAGLWLGYSVQSGMRSRSSGPPARPSPTPEYLKVVRANWDKGGFGRVAIWSVVFQNESTKPIGNIRYTTVYFSETGGDVSTAGNVTERVLQKVIPAGESRELPVNDGFVNPQAHKAKFVLHGWEFVADQR